MTYKEKIQSGFHFSGIPYSDAACLGLSQLMNSLVVNQDTLAGPARYFRPTNNFATTGGQVEHNSPSSGDSTALNLIAKDPN